MRHIARIALGMAFGVCVALAGGLLGTALRKLKQKVCR